MILHMSLPDVQVRPVTAADRRAVRELALGNHMFAPEEMSGLDEMLAGYLDGDRPDDHWVAAEADGGVLGAGYWGPEPFGYRVWNLYFLAVRPAAHGQGVGTAIVRHVVDRLQSVGQDVARVLLVETSSTADYEQARLFYAAREFVEEARIRDFYGPRNDKVVFWRRIERRSTTRRN
jgi:ribosomal protein S18 acetylase RimI-like enzyme